MKAMVFAAGLGSRLKPFTEQHPKALVTVKGIPMLERVILNLKHQGITDIIINVHHFSGQIYDFLERNGNFGVNVIICDETAQLLDTGGGILNAREFLEDAPFLVYNVDILSDIDIRNMAKAHKSSGADVTLLGRIRNTTRYLYFNEETHRLQGWANVTNGEVRPDGFVPEESMLKLAFGGVSIVSPSVFPVLERHARKTGKVFPIIPFYTSNVHNLDIRAYRPRNDYYWFDIGTSEKLAEAEKYISTKE